MMAWVHASIGAFIGSRTRSRKRAFAAGVVSHGVADLFPHRDYNVNVELPLVSLALGYIAIRYGISSSEMAGALGGIFPDAENFFYRFGFVKHMLYPTHTSMWWFVGHGKPVKNPTPQIVLAALCLYAAHHMAKNSGRK
jgi:hypothetical protein